jgi:AraC-like DNA-binding protein
MIIKPLFTSYGEFNSSRKIGPVSWPHFDLLVIHSGSVKISFMDSRSKTLNASQAVLIFPETAFKGSSVSGRSLASVHHFKFSESDEEFKDIANLKRGYILGKDLPEQFMSDVSRSLELEDSQSFEREALLRLILSVFLKIRKQNHPFAKTLFRISRNLHQQIRIDELALAAGLSNSHFRKLFREQFNISPAKYIRKAKIEAACKMLVRTREPVKSIAFQLGFDEVPHFHRTFKAETGMTPAKYRKKKSPVG